MKKLHLFVSVIISAALLCSCSITGYRYVCENGNSYIIMDYPQPTENIGGSSVVPSISFSSIGEMVSCIRNGNFTDSEKEMLAQFSRDKEGRILTFDLENVYIPILPDEANESTANIEWYGAWFGYYSNCAFGCFDYEQMERSAWESMRESSTKVEGKTVVGYDSERNAAVYKFQSGMGELHQVIFEIEIDGMNAYICEYFREYPGTPFRIIVFSTTETASYIIRFRVLEGTLSERPSIDFLKQLRVSKYIEE